MGTTLGLAKNLEDIQASLIAKKRDYKMNQPSSELCEKLVDITVIMKINLTSNLQKRTADVFSKRNLLMIQS